jgi:uncharacterized protein (TIGR02466 family)
MSKEYTASIYPLFSSVVYSTNINVPMKEKDKIFKLIKKQKYIKHSNNIKNSSDISENFFVLNKSKFLKKNIMDHFNYFKDNVLHYKKVNFKITTSWISKTLSGSESEYHPHYNCWYSGVYYPGVDNSPIEFANHNQQHSFFTEATEYNVYNSKVFEIKPNENSLIFFPHYLYHRVKKSNNDRYSIAFNLLPEGSIGFRDSFIILKHG